MKLPVRYHVMESVGPDDNAEANIVHAAATVELDVAEVAIVLVDTWAGHPMPSHLERTGEICRTRIRPLLDAARAAGATVIYAPSPRVAPDFEDLRHDSRETAPPAPNVDDWPPQEYRETTVATRRCASAPGNSRRTMTGRFPTGSPFTASTRQSRRRRKTWWWRPARSCTRRARRAAWRT